MGVVVKDEAAEAGLVCLRSPSSSSQLIRAAMPNKRMKKGHSVTVWKFDNFTATQILREIKYGNFRAQTLLFWPFWRS